MREPKERGAIVQSVDRAVAVLEHLSSCGECGVTEVAQALGTHKSTAYRLLTTLKDRGLVEQDVETDRYRLGMGLVYLASSVTADLDMVSYARPVCERLRAETQGTVTVSVLVGNDVMVVYQAMSSSAVLNVNWRGKHLPLHCTSDGKVLLAHLPEARQAAILDRPLQRFTRLTIADPEVLRRQLHTIRDVGYGYTVEELEIGLNAVAAPVYADGGTVVGTLGLSGPAVRLPASAIPELGTLVKTRAAEISSALSRAGAGPLPRSEHLPA